MNGTPDEYETWAQSMNVVELEPGPTARAHSAPASHPWTATHPPCVDTVEPPEMVVDDVIAAGAVVVAGERGLGKTSVMVPLLMAATGLLSNYPLKASIRRQVIYVAEDIAQVQRIFAAMRAGGLLQAPPAEVNEWFHLVEANRLRPQQIAMAAPLLSERTVPNECTDGSVYHAPPVLALDTTNATIDLEDISSNSSVSRAVSAIRQAFRPMPLVMLGHVSKASRSDARQLSFVGAGAWEGDTQQTLYLVTEQEQRYLVIGKRRFEPDATEFEVIGHRHEFTARDKLGREVTTACFYSTLHPICDAEKQRLKEKREQEAKQEAWHARLAAVVKFVQKNPGSTKREIRNAVTGKGTAIDEAVAHLADTGELRTEIGHRNTARHYAAAGHTGTHRADLDD